MVTDFHAHAFPDEIAPKAIEKLQQGGDIEAKLDGTTADLLRSMDRAGIDRAVICSIATRPAQFDNILRWSRDVASDRLVPLPSIHPADEHPAEQVRRVRDAGLKGIKLHPYYQDFRIDDEHIFPLYEALQEEGLLLVSHTGFDFAFPRVRKCDPEKVLRVIRRFPNLRFVATHLGGWQDWDEVERHLLGEPVYMETSFSVKLLSLKQARRMLRGHHANRLLFGTDSPWTDQQAATERLKNLGLDEELETRILSQNAANLLDRVSA